jgi:hypothetical protein
MMYITVGEGGGGPWLSKSNLKYYDFSYDNTAVHYKCNFVNDIPSCYSLRVDLNGTMTFIIITFGRMTSDRMAVGRMTCSEMSFGRMTCSEISFGRMTSDRITFRRRTCSKINFGRLTFAESYLTE